mmetsp:Transcript_6104/g.12409  ORF Transcript_6104/g.12409 Transcript_6104/m.12409 type:complete len:208 (+) Transcript_6104:809-1432(+)
MNPFSDAAALKASIVRLNRTTVIREYSASSITISEDLGTTYCAKDSYIASQSRLLCRCTTASKVTKFSDSTYLSADNTPLRSRTARLPLSLRLRAERLLFITLNSFTRTFRSSSRIATPALMFSMVSFSGLRDGCLASSHWKAVRYLSTGTPSTSRASGDWSGLISVICRDTLARVCSATAQDFTRSSLNVSSESSVPTLKSGIANL